MVLQVGKVSEEQRLLQKIASAKLALKKYKYNMGVYEPNASAVKSDGTRKDPQAYKLYQENKKHFDEITAEIAGYQKQIDAINKTKKTASIADLKKQYAEVRNKLDAVVDVNGSTAKNLQKQLASILADYKKVTGIKDDLKAKSDLDAERLKKAGQTAAQLGVPGFSGTKPTGPTGPTNTTKSTTATGPKGTGPKGTGPTGPKPTGPTGPTVTGSTGADVTITGIDNIIKAAVAAGFGGIDTVFKTVPELTALITRAVNEKWTKDRFQSELENTNWFKSTATSLQQRGFYKRQYTDLVNAIPAGAADREAQIEALGNTTEYGRGLASVKRLIQAEAISEGAVIDNKALDLLAQDIYDHALERDSSAIRNYVSAQIKYNPTAVLSGKAGTDLAALRSTAMANGLDLDKAFGNSIQGWLQKLANGESVETYKSIIRQAAKTGMSDRVQSLLDNGVDLESIFSPYKNLMANTLEINPYDIKLGDVISRATTPKGEMNLYDFGKLLRKDDRWQYTQQAHQEVADATKKVLQDFGFMG